MGIALPYLFHVRCCTGSAQKDGADAGEPDEVTGVVPHQAFDDLFTVGSWKGHMTGSELRVLDALPSPR